MKLVKCIKSESDVSWKKFSAPSEDSGAIAQTVNLAKRFLLDHGSFKMHTFQFELEVKKYKARSSQKFWGHPSENCDYKS